ncbi:unnamed protein product [Sphenostylis stenocarpa]|uniref:Uncharacterized protein n=1 Tax=Sphenostylis stenocarpa TaxID=92480 RepID=A0AA86VHU4_9FABA|nr:unnamed protein product [Sphenostylis stenocarpa]
MNVDEGRNSDIVEEGWVMGGGLRRHVVVGASETRGDPQCYLAMLWSDRRWVTTVARKQVENKGLVRGRSEGTTLVMTGLWWSLVVRWTHCAGRWWGGGACRGSHR